MLHGAEKKERSFAKEIGDVRGFVALEDDAKISAQDAVIMVFAGEHGRVSDELLACTAKS
jgi:hypothetical protein